MSHVRSLFLLATLLFSTLSAQARTSFEADANGRWAVVIIESRVRRWGGEPLCSGPDSLRLFDALRVRPELEVEAVVRRYRGTGMSVSCQNVRQLGFVSCSLYLEASDHVEIDPGRGRLHAEWSAEEARALSGLWDFSCAGSGFASDDGRFRMSWAADRVEWIYTR